MPKLSAYSTFVALSLALLLAGCGLFNNGSTTSTTSSGATSTQSAAHNYISTNGFVGTVDAVTTIPGSNSSCVLSVHDDSNNHCQVFIDLANITKMQAGMTATTLTTVGTRIQFYVSQCNSECPTSEVNFTAESVAQAPGLPSPTPVPTAVPAGAAFIAGSFSLGNYGGAAGTTFTPATAAQGGPFTLTFDATNGAPTGTGSFAFNTAAGAATSCTFSCAVGNGTDLSGNAGIVAITISNVKPAANAAANTTCPYSAGGTFLIGPELDTANKKFVPGTTAVAAGNAIECRGPTDKTYTFLTRTL